MTARWYTESDAIAANECPSPFADAVAAMFLSGVSAPTVAAFFRIDLADVAALVRWVCDTNMRRASN